MSSPRPYFTYLFITSCLFYAFPRYYDNGMIVFLKNCFQIKTERKRLRPPCELQHEYEYNLYMNMAARLSSHVYVPSKSYTCTCIC